MTRRTKIHKFIEFNGRYGDLKDIGFQWLGPPHNDSMIWEKNEVFIYRRGSQVKFNQLVCCSGQLLSLIQEYTRENKAFPIENGLLVCYINDELAEMSFTPVDHEWKRRCASMESFMVLVDLFNRGWVNWVEEESEFLFNS